MKRTRAQRSSRPIWLGDDRRTWDHVRIHLQLIHDERLDHYCIATYCGLVAHAELETGRTFPAIPTLAKYARCSEFSVRKALKILTDTKYISIEKKPGHPSIYKVLSPPLLSPASHAVLSPAPDAGEGFVPRDTPPRDARHTPASHADELEPRTRTINNDAPAPYRQTPLPPLPLCPHGLTLKAHCEECEQKGDILPPFPERVTSESTGAGA